MKKRLLIGMLLATATLAFAEGKPQTTCPVMGGKINKTQYIDIEGYRIYTCCKPCIAKIKANPEKHIKQMKAAGIEIEKAPAPKK